MVCLSNENSTNTVASYSFIFTTNILYLYCSRIFHFKKLDSLRKLATFFLRKNFQLQWNKTSFDGALKINKLFDFPSQAYVCFTQDNFFWMLALLRRIAFLTPSMVYISIISIHIKNYNLSLIARRFHHYCHYQNIISRNESQLQETTVV